MFASQLGLGGQADLLDLKVREVRLDSPDEDPDCLTVDAARPKEELQLHTSASVLTPHESARPSEKEGGENPTLLCRWL